MLRIDETRWIKAGIELSDGSACIGSVLTLGRSDWTSTPYQGDPIRLLPACHRIARRPAPAVLAGREALALLRLCPFPVAAHYQVGPMCCTRNARSSTFASRNSRSDRPARKALHDLT